MRYLAINGDVVVVGVDYSLSPEHKFPVAINEILAILSWLQNQGNLDGLDTENIGIAGDSAGGSIAMGAAISLKMQKLPQFSYMLFYYGVFGLRDSSSYRLYGDSNLTLSTRDMDYYYDCYLPDDLKENDIRWDIISATDLSDMPPTFLLAAELDPLLDDSIALAAMLKDDGVSCQLKIYKGMLHGFLNYKNMVSEAKESLEDSAAFIRASNSKIM